MEDENVAKMNKREEKQIKELRLRVKDFSYRGKKSGILKTCREKRMNREKEDE